jgi:UPF0755 protein
VHRRFFWILLALSALLGAFGLWLQHEFASPYFGGGNEERFVDIPRGAGTNAIADALLSGGVLHARLPFVLYIRWAGLGRRLQAGEYRFSAPARPVEIVRRLVQGDAYFRTVVIPEGLTARETIELLARNGFGNERELAELIHRVDWISDQDNNADDLEGYLFPDTYRFPRQSSSEEILRVMVAQFRSRMSRLRAATPLPAGWNLRQIVTLASMIEKEAGNAEERRLVSSVLTNRLRRKIPLACDPTIIYAMKQAGTYHGNLRKTDLGMASPYNSYLHPGLPPGPIANPGSDSLAAALSPAVSDYLYYVARNDGTHYFSKDLQSHLQAVSRYQKRGTRSPGR